MEAGIEGLKTTLIICMIIFIVVITTVGLIKYFDKQFTKRRRERHLKDIFVGDTYATTITDMSEYPDNPFIVPETYVCMIDDVRVNCHGVVWVKYHYCNQQRKNIKYDMESATSFLSKFTKVENTNK